MDCTSDIVKNLNQSLNIDEENLIFRSNFGTILGEIFQNLISGGGTTIPDPRVIDFNLFSIQYPLKKTGNDPRETIFFLGTTEMLKRIPNRTQIKS